MATNRRALISFIRHALPGLFGGGCIGALIVLLMVEIAPPIFVASVVMFHKPGSGLSDSGRDLIANTINNEAFYRTLATNNSWDVDEAKAIAANLSVTAKDASRPKAELRLHGADGETLGPKLDVIAEEIVKHHRAKQKSSLQWMLGELDANLTSARERLEKLAPSGREQSVATKSALSIATRLTQRRREAELATRYRLQRESSFEEHKRRQRLRAIAKAEQQQIKTIAADPIVAAEFDDARLIATLSAEKQALEQTQKRLDIEFATIEPVQILRRNDPVAQSRDVATDLLFFTALGSFAGLLIGGGIWSKKQSAPKFLHPSLLEKSLRCSVVGVMPEPITEFGEREHSILATHHPEHLAMAAIHSLRIGLRVLATPSERATEVVICEFGRPRHAAHLIANLALSAATAGERVLVIDAAGSATLTSLLTNAKALRIAQLDAGAFSPEPVGSAPRDHTALCYFIDDARDHAGIIALAESNAARSNFDTIFVNVIDSPSTRQLLAALERETKLLVCANEVKLAALRKAPLKLYDGIVLCGNSIDESAYQGGAETS